MQIINSVLAASQVTPNTNTGINAQAGVLVGPQVEISKLFNPSGIPVGSKITDIFTKGGFNLINFIFIIVGLLFFANLVLTGWEYMMSSGDPKKVQAATTRLTNGFIGLILAVLAFVIVRLVTTVLGLDNLV